ncbi:MAG TPA: DUF2628 domain-containing protein [Pararhizobium sp.]|nr:DUF2628 domain-containing protein [Pararhizobium sp.]
MASYVVLIPPGADAGDERAIVQRDGFLWLALIAPLLWFIWYRIWLWAALYLVIGFAVALVVERTGWGGTAIVLGIITSFWAALEAGGLRIAELRRRGWNIADVVVAPGRAEAEAIYFRNAAALNASTPAAPAIEARRPRPRDDGPALGLFDHD